VHALIIAVAVALITSIGWRSTYRVFAVITLVLMVPLMLLVRNRPSDVGLRAYGDTGAAVGSATSAAPAPVLQGVSASVAMKSAAFYLCALFAICAGLISSVTQLFPTYARTLPISAHNVGLGATLVSVVMASVALSKIFLGYLNDKSMVLAITFGVVCGAAGLLGMWILPTSAALLLISGALFGPLMALTTIQLPLLIRAVFGVREFSKIYSRVATFMSLIGAFGITIFSLVVASAGWAGLFALLVGLAVVVYLAVMLGIRFGKGLVFTKAELDTASS
jgi:MFS family permease